jgi:ammonia channel protein AmtB
MDNDVAALTTVFTEFYYWITVPLMFLIHVGFCMYEVGASRRKNHMHTLMKNSMVIPLVTVTWFFFGWWLYWAFAGGPGITGGLGHPTPDLLAYYAPWGDGMGPRLDDRISGVFWAAFLLFAWTAASIVSGAVIERIRSFGFWVIAILIGSVTWSIDAAWGWHYNGWMVELLGYHDAYASGVIHAIAGGTALAVLVVLGPRLGKFAPDGTPRDILPHNAWLVCIGLFLIYTGFWGFYVACNVPLATTGYIGGQITGDIQTATTIYLTPTTLSAITMNFLLSLAGGMLVGYMVSKGDAFWTYSGGLAGIITASAGNDLYHPLQALIIGGVGTFAMYKIHYWVERKFKVDDAVGAVAVHGYAGVIGLVIAGFVLWGHPSSPYEGFAEINPLGQIAGAIIMFFGLGFIPAWIVSKILNSMGLLRIPREVELLGLDFKNNKEAEAARQDVIAAERQAAS